VIKKEAINKNWFAKGIADILLPKLIFASAFEKILFSKIQIN